MKRIALIATAALCALAMCLCSIPALSVFAEDDTPELTNVALNSYVTVFASQALNDGGAHWFPDALTDGVKNPNNGLLLAPGGDWTAPVDSPIDITMELGARYTIYSVDLYAAYGGYALPIAYTISVSDDGVDFTPVVAVTDGAQIAEKYTVEFDEPATGSYLRLTIINGCDIDWGGAAFCAIGELEAWGVAADPLPVETETETETTPVVNETETEAPAPAETETEAPAETVVESDVESAEETDTETTVDTVEETAGETGVEETVAETKAETKAPAAAADEGCASVVGMGAVAVLTAAAAAVVLKKKD